MKSGHNLQNTTTLLFSDMHSSWNVWRRFCTKKLRKSGLDAGFHNTRPTTTAEFLKQISHSTLSLSQITSMSLWVYVYQQVWLQKSPCHNCCHPFLFTGKGFIVEYIYIYPYSWKRPAAYRSFCS